MLAAFIEAVLRSLILALVVWAALRIFRVQNVVSQRSAWIAVLVGSLLMPFALPFTARWHVLPLATIPTPTSLDGLRPALAQRHCQPRPNGIVRRPMIVAPRQDESSTLQTAVTTVGRNRGHALSSDSVQLPNPSAGSAQPDAVRGKFSLSRCRTARLPSGRRHTPSPSALWLRVRTAPLVFLHSSSIGRRHAD